MYNDSCWVANVSDGSTHDTDEEVEEWLCLEKVVG